MRFTALVLATGALAFAASLSAQPATSIAAEIAAIEQAWAQAFRTGDMAYIESIVAQEFKLMGERGGAAHFTPRAEWMANTRNFVFHRFEVRTVDVVTAGDTAVATVEGSWTVGRKGLPGTRASRFIVSDTFVKREGKWQVVYRHATTVGAPAVAEVNTGGGIRQVH